MTGRRALVTGGARGIGAAICVTLRTRGADVLAPSRAELDLASPDAVEQWIAANRHIPIDILVNNAGINEISAVDALSPALLRRSLQVNLEAPARLISVFAPGMSQRGWGRIVNIASVWTVVARGGRAAYAGAKSGLVGLTREAALELAPRGVLVNAVSPGFVETDLTRRNNTAEQLAAIVGTIPVGRLGAPEEIARTVAFLCSDDNTYLTGQNLVVDGGYTLR